MEKHYVSLWPPRVQQMMDSHRLQDKIFGYMLASAMIVGRIFAVVVFGMGVFIITSYLTSALGFKRTLYGQTSTLPKIYDLGIIGGILMGLAWVYKCMTSLRIAIVDFATMKASMMMVVDSAGWTMVGLVGLSAVVKVLSTIACWSPWREMFW